MGGSLEKQWLRLWRHSVPFQNNWELLNICKQGNGVAVAELWNDKSRIGRVRLKGKRP